MDPWTGRSYPSLRSVFRVYRLVLPTPGGLGKPNPGTLFLLSSELKLIHRTKDESSFRPDTPRCGRIRTGKTRDGSPRDSERRPWYQRRPVQRGDPEGNQSQTLKNGLGYRQRSIMDSERVKR